MFVLLFGAQAWLYVNFLLGNDTLVRLEASTDSFSLVHGESASVVFEAGVTANTFCKTACTSVFEDIGRNELVEEHSFEVYAGNPFRR